MKRHGPWRTLGLDPTEDRASIRRAYADKLRELDVDRDIDGYARLRQARDHALALAKSLAEAQAEPAVDADGARHHQLEETESAAGGEVLERPALEQSDRPEGDEPAEPPPPQVLLSILYPDGETSEAPLSAEEWELARQALTAILAQAEDSPIDQHAAIDGWLAHHLASTWPRSAWLVEPSADAFGWMGESGQLTEQPAVQFLNHRLKGLRFVAKVEQPSHPLHKAWVELSKPGSRGAFGFMRANKGDVQRLLAGVRERYPEVESYLDPQRVASWDTVGEVSPTSAWIGFARVIAVVAVVGLGRLCTGALDTAPPPPPIVVQAPWSAEQVDALVVELFGERLDNVTLRTKATELWINIDHARADDGNRPGQVEDVTKELLIQLRGQTQLAAREATGVDLIAIKQVKLALLRLVCEQGGVDDCLDYETQALVSSNIEVPEDVRRDERALAKRLVEAGLFQPLSGSYRMTARIPGDVIERVIRTSGLSEAAVRQAAQGQGGEEALCSYHLALLEAVLRRPGEASIELLRIL